MNPYDCVIFDCDGVLVDSEIIGNTILVEMANEYGAQIDLPFALQHFKGNALKNCIQIIEKRISQKLPNDIEFSFRKRSAKSFKKYLKPIDGIVEVLEQLNIPVCVASSGPISKIKLNLKITGLYSYFKGNLFSCYNLNKWKPHPAVFLHAAEIMGYRPANCLVIEDSIMGIEAALRGGFDVAAYLPQEINNYVDLQNPTFIIKDMRELLELV